MGLSKGRGGVLRRFVRERLRWLVVCDFFVFISGFGFGFLFVRSKRERFIDFIRM